MRMRVAVVALVAVAALVVVSTVPALAITHGEPDDGEHPYVGLMVFHNQFGWSRCSGSALTNDVFLTAGHCLADVTTDLDPPGGSRGTDVWVTFAERSDLVDAPPGDEARVVWLGDPTNGFIRGVSNPHPAYDDFASFPNTHDVGIVELDSSAGLGSFAVLADLGALDEIGTGKDHNKVIVETSGYGVIDLKPHVILIDWRFKSTSKIVSLDNAQTDGFNVRTSNNPSGSHGTGGSCFGDSGGPIMFNNTNVVVATVSFGNQNCTGGDYGYRADIADTQDFVNDFLD